MMKTVCKVLLVLAIYLRLGISSAVYLQCKDTDYQPICASNNRTFPNECFLRVYNLYGDGSNVTKVTDGPCNGDGKAYEEETAHESPEMNQPPMEHEIYIAKDIEDPESLTGTSDVVLDVDPKSYISKGLNYSKPTPKQNYVPAATSLPPGDTPAHPPTKNKYVPAAPAHTPKPYSPQDVSSQPPPSYPTAQTSAPPGDVPVQQSSTPKTEYPKSSYA